MTKAGPYYENAGRYLMTDLWSQVIPIVPGVDKKPRVAGCHGGDPREVTANNVGTWRQLHPADNVGVVMPRGVIVIDVDGYGAKNGFITMDLLSHRLGPLPPAPMSSARDDGSGKFYFRVDSDIERWPGNLGKNTHVDVIWWGNRYVVAPPSLHHTGRRERWRLPEGTLAPAEWLPTAADLPAFPEPWVEHLQGLASKGGSAGDYDADVEVEWWEMLTPEQAQRKLKRLMTWVLDRTEGERNSGLHWAACRAAEAVPRGMDPGLAVECLVAAGIDIGLDEDAARRTVEQKFRKYLTDTKKGNPA